MGERDENKKECGALLAATRIGALSPSLHLLVSPPAGRRARAGRSPWLTAWLGVCVRVCARAGVSGGQGAGRMREREGESVPCCLCCRLAREHSPSPTSFFSGGGGAATPFLLTHQWMVHTHTHTPLPLLSLSHSSTLHALLSILQPLQQPFRLGRQGALTSASLPAVPFLLLCDGRTATTTTTTTTSTTTTTTSPSPSPSPSPSMHLV